MFVEFHCILYCVAAILAQLVSVELYVRLLDFSFSYKLL